MAHDASRTTRYNVTEAARVSQFPRGTLVRRLENAEFKRLTGYDDDSKTFDALGVELLVALYAKREDSRFKPEALERSIAEMGLDAVRGLVLGDASRVTHDASLEMVETAITHDASRMTHDARIAVEILSTAIAQAVAASLPPQDDALLTRDQVRELLAGIYPPKDLARVKIGSRVRWRRSDVLRYIARLGT